MSCSVELRQRRQQGIVEDPHRLAAMMNKSQRLVLGLLVLLLVDIIWVSSSELTKVRETPVDKSSRCPPHSYFIAYYQVLYICAIYIYFYDLVKYLDLCYTCKVEYRCDDISCFSTSTKRRRLKNHFSART